MSAAERSATTVAPRRPPVVRRRSRRKIILLTLLVLLVVALVWAATSSNPLAVALQEAGGAKHDQAIVDTPFTLSPHNFRYYKFTLPEGSTHVAIVGQFQAAAAPGNRDSTNKDGNPPAGIEVFVLSESGFAIWQGGYAAGPVYESGKVGNGTIEQDLPAGAGVYYLIFSNRADPKAGKKVIATVLLRYKSWFPTWFRRMKNGTQS